MQDASAWPLNTFGPTAGPVLDGGFDAAQLAPLGFGSADAFDPDRFVD